MGDAVPGGPMATGGRRHPTRAGLIAAPTAGWEGRNDGGGASNSTNRSEGIISPPGATGGWGDAHLLLSLLSRRLPAIFTPSIILAPNEAPAIISAN